MIEVEAGEKEAVCKLGFSTSEWMSCLHLVMLPSFVAF